MAIEVSFEKFDAREATALLKSAYREGWSWRDAQNSA